MKFSTALAAFLIMILLAACDNTERLLVGTSDNPVFADDFEWVVFNSEDGMFSAEFPAPPHAEVRDIPGGIENRLTLYYTFNKDGKGGMLRISYFDVPAADMEGVSSAEIYDGVIQTMPAEVVVTGSESGQVAGFETRMFKIDDMKTMMVLVENRLYMIYAGDDAVSTRFLESFKPL